MAYPPLAYVLKVCPYSVSLFCEVLETNKWDPGRMFLGPYLTLATSCIPCYASRHPWCWLLAECFPTRMH